ncbi:MAG: DUF2807 domain-containing protein [Clostridia bacterium]|nr:DUF2807 domain-containing protein [Clostridia bacterium]
MKKFVLAMIIIVAVGALIAGVGCAVYFKGTSRLFTKDAEYAEKTFISSASFNEIDMNLRSGHRLILQRGEDYSLTYSDSLLTTFSVAVQGGKLRINETASSMKWWHRVMYKEQTTDIILTVPEETILSLRGTISGSLSAELPDWEYGDFDLDISGSTELKAANITAKSIAITASGSAKFGARGTFQDISVRASGSADIELSGVANSLSAKVSGSVELSCTQLTCPTITVDGSGSTDIELSGSGNKLTVHSSGSTEISAKDFALTVASVHSSGSCEIELNVSERLTVSVSGSADIKYWGNPIVENLGSNNANIKKMD